MAPTSSAPTDGRAASVRLGEATGGVIVRQLAGPPGEAPTGACVPRGLDGLGGNTLLGLRFDSAPAGGTVEHPGSFAETVVFVVSGSGRTDFTDGEHMTVPPVDWHAGDLFAMPPTASTTHVADASGPVELLTFSNAPMLVELFGTVAFLRAPFPLHDRFDAAQGWGWSSTSDDGSAIVNRLRDVPRVAVAAAPHVGRGVAMLRARIGGHRTLEVAVLELGHRAHVRRHRHLVEESIVVLGGRGRTVLSDGRGQERTFRWRAGDVFVPPLGVWHQHVSEAKPWDRTRLLVVRNRALEHAFEVRPGGLDTRLPDRHPVAVGPASSMSGPQAVPGRGST